MMLTSRLAVLDPEVSDERSAAMQTTAVVPTRAVVCLSLALAVVVAAVAAVGLFATGGPGPHEVLTNRGQSAQLYGTGLYRYDSWLVGVGNRGSDAVTLFLE